MRENDLTILAPGTFIRGNLFSESVLVIEGGIEGDIRGNRVIVKPQGWIHGNVLCRSLSIEPGGVVDGEVKVESGGDLLLPSQNKRPSLPPGKEAGSNSLPILEDAKEDPDPKAEQADNAAS